MTDAPETITLPRSGVVLTRSVSPWCWTSGTGVAFFEPHFTGDESGYAIRGQYVYSRAKTRDVMFGELDARVLALRAALLPAGLRERIARALYESDRDSTPRNRGWSEWPGLLPGSFGIEYGVRADAVLAVIHGEESARDER